jgi:hypothetical protein
MAHKDSFELIVNLEVKTVSDRKVTFDEIVKLAFPDKVGAVARPR